MRSFLPGFAIALLVGCASPGKLPIRESAITLHDGTRQRDIPVQLYFPARSAPCSAARPCPVAFLSPGYGLPHTAYSFIADALNDLGYLVVAIQNQLPSDPPLATSGNLQELRAPSWAQGAENIRFARSELSRSHPQFDWRRLVLIGHSNGGDISAWLARESPERAATLITLDHRRMPLPRDGATNVLSIRAGDFPADAGVLPASGACIVTLGYARHNDMHDGGSAELRHDVSALIKAFLRDGSCPRNRT